MSNLIFDIKDALETQNTIFAGNAFVYETQIEFEEGGPSDRYCNLFYLRQPGTNVKDYQLSAPFEGILTITSNWRAVFQIQDTVNVKSACEALRTQLQAIDQVQITSFTFDTQKAYASEYSKGVINRGFNLICIDFTLQDEEIECNNVCFEDICPELCV